MIRKADINDKEALIELFKELVAHHVAIEPVFFTLPYKGSLPYQEFYEENINSAMIGENTEIWVNDDNGINAYAVIKFVDIDYPDRYPYKMCYIDFFSVKKIKRRSGIGGALMEEIRKRAKEEDCRCVQLKVRAANRGAVRFYEKAGFTANEIVMTKKL